MRPSSSRSIAVLIALLGAASCDTSEVPSVSTSTPPAHPAMSAPIGSKGGSTSPMDALPAGHPPVGSSPPGSGRQGDRAAGGSCVERLAALGLVCKLPAGWVEETPTEQMRIGQVRLPRAAGDAEDGELSIIPAMGSIQANVSRWSGQFVENPQAVLTERKVGDVQATIVELEGTFTGGGGPMMKGPTEPRPGTKLIGVIVSVPGSQQMLFFKAWGPKATMEHWRPSFDELIGSFQARR